jgi:hypothetical protein
MTIEKIRDVGLLKPGFARQLDAGQLACLDLFPEGASQTLL